MSAQTAVSSGMLEREAYHDGLALVLHDVT